MILAIHGVDGSPDALAPLLDTWTKAGYVVVAPTFPKTKKDARGKALRAEVVDQAADARFVLDEVLDRADEFGIDPDEVGAAGMSLGGMTVYGLISHTCCEDGRISAAVVMSGVHDPLPSGRYEHQDVPVLLLHGDADTGYRHSHVGVRAARAAEVVRHAARRAPRTAVRGAAQCDRDRRRSPRRRRSGTAT